MKKKRNYYLIMTVMLFLVGGLIGCVDDGNDKPDGPISGKETYATFYIKLPPASRGASGEQVGSTEESKLQSEIVVVVFDAESNKHEYTYDDVTLTPSSQTEYKTSTIKLTSGEKYIYIFSTSNKNLIKPGMDIKSFETGIVDANITVSGNNVIPANLATSDNFFIGTLWGDAVTVSAGGTATNPQTIGPLKIGRLASKVVLTSINKGSSSPLKGTFVANEAEYVVRSVPTSIYLVGQYDTGTESSPNDPPGKGTNGVQVFSAVHNEPWNDKAPNDDKQNPKFTNYEWAQSQYISTSTGNAKPKTGFYIVENTTAYDQQNNNQYYGNTTYIQLRIQYIPDRDELWKHDNPEEPAETGMGSNKTFWVVNVPGKGLRFFATDPTGQAWLDGKLPTKYENGLVTYAVPIKDETETDGLLQHTVIRNHWYSLAVTGINNIGSNTADIVPPDTPIGKETIVDIEIEVMNWALVSQNIIF